MALQELQKNFSLKYLVISGYKRMLFKIIVSMVMHPHSTSNFYSCPSPGLTLFNKNCDLHLLVPIFLDPFSCYYLHQNFDHSYQIPQMRIYIRHVSHMKILFEVSLPPSSNPSHIRSLDNNNHVIHFFFFLGCESNQANRFYFWTLAHTTNKVWLFIKLLQYTKNSYLISCKGVCVVNQVWLLIRLL